MSRYGRSVSGRLHGGLICFLTVAFGVPSAQAGTLYGFSPYVFDQSGATDVWTINPVNGQTSLAATGIPCSPYGGAYSAFDPTNQILYIAGALNSGTALCETNLTTGVTTDIAVSDAELFFSPGFGTLYGYGYYNSSGPTDVWTINPVSGQTNVVASGIPCNPFAGAYAAFDPTNQILYIAGALNSGTALCETNLTTGVTTDIAGSYGSPVSDAQLFFSAGTLYGYGYYNGSSSTDLWTINPATGQTSVVATGIPCNPFEGKYAAFDPASQLLYIAGAVGSGTALCTTDLTTGVTTSLAGAYNSPVSDVQLFLNSASPVPEPATFILALGGLGCLVAMRRSHA